MHAYINFVKFCGRGFTQGRRHESFKGRALGGSRGGLPHPFFNFQGGGAQPQFLVDSMVNMKEFSGQGGPWPPLPTPAYALDPVCVFKM